MYKQPDVELQLRLGMTHTRLLGSKEESSKVVILPQRRSVLHPFFLAYDHVVASLHSMTRTVAMIECMTRVRAVLVDNKLTATDSGIGRGLPY